MTADPPPDDITSEAELQEAIHRVLIAGYRNDVSVAGGLTCRNHDPDLPDWDVTITELRKPDEERA